MTASAPRQKSGGRIGANALFVLLVPGIVGLAAPLAIHSLSPESLRFNWTPGKFLGAAAIIGGLSLYASGMRAQLRAGESPSPLVRSMSLVTEGIYSVTRNPMYVAGAAWFAGLAALLQSGPLIGYALCVILAYYPLLVRSEERVLRRRFGAEYDAYCARTPRWLPIPGFVRSGSK